jgi:hypothetical protein
MPFVESVRCGIGSNIANSLNGFIGLAASSSTKDMSELINFKYSPSHAIAPMPPNFRVVFQVLHPCTSKHTAFRYLAVEMVDRIRYEELVLCIISIIKSLHLSGDLVLRALVRDGLTGARFYSKHNAPLLTTNRLYIVRTFFT